MIGGVDNSKGLAYEAMLAALKSQTDATMRTQSGATPSSGSPSTEGAKGTDFIDALSSLAKDGLAGVQEAASDVDRIVPDMMTGKVEDLHEVAMRINQADLTLRFSLEVRNKLIDAYREVMRMSV